MYLVEIFIFYNFLSYHYLNEYVESNGTQTNQDRILYDIDYQCDVNEKAYTGKIYCGVDKKV